MYDTLTRWCLAQEASRHAWALAGIQSGYSQLMLVAVFALVLFLGGVLAWGHWQDHRHV